MSDISKKYSGEGTDRVMTVEIQNEYLGLNRRDDLNRILQEEIENGTKNFSFDLSNLETINSSGLGILIASLKKIKDSGCSLKLINANDKVAGIFKLTRLNNVFEF